jgi:hypothetical protein
VQCSALRSEFHNLKSRTNDADPRFNHKKLEHVCAASSQGAILNCTFFFSGSFLTPTTNQSLAPDRWKPTRQKMGILPFFFVFLATYTTPQKPEKKKSFLSGLTIYFSFFIFWFKNLPLSLLQTFAYHIFRATF